MIILPILTNVPHSYKGLPQCFARVKSQILSDSRLSFLLVIGRLERARCTTTRETGVSEVDGRADASRSLQSLNYCG